MSNDAPLEGQETPAPLDLEAIRKRVRREQPVFSTWLVDDITALLAEVERLRAALSGSAQATRDNAPRFCGSCSGRTVERRQWVCIACNLIAYEGEVEPFATRDNALSGGEPVAVGYYRPTDEFRACPEHVCVMREDQHNGGTPLVMCGPAGDPESEALAVRLRDYLAGPSEAEPFAWLVIDPWLQRDWYLGPTRPPMPDHYRVVPLYLGAHRSPDVEGIANALLLDGWTNLSVHNDHVAGQLMEDLREALNPEGGQDDGR